MRHVATFGRDRWLGRPPTYRYDALTVRLLKAWRGQLCPPRMRHDYESFFGCLWTICQSHWALAPQSGIEPPGSIGRKFTSFHRTALQQMLLDCFVVSFNMLPASRRVTMCPSPFDREYGNTYGAHGTSGFGKCRTSTTSAPLLAKELSRVKIL